MLFFFYGIEGVVHLTYCSVLTTYVGNLTAPYICKNKEVYRRQKMCLPCRPQLDMTAAGGPNRLDVT